MSNTYLNVIKKKVCVSQIEHHFLHFETQLNHILSILMIFSGIAARQQGVKNYNGLIQVPYEHPVSFWLWWRGGNCVGPSASASRPRFITYNQIYWHNTLYEFQDNKPKLLDDSLERLALSAFRGVELSVSEMLFEGLSAQKDTNY